MGAGAGLLELEHTVQVQVPGEVEVRMGPGPLNRKKERFYLTTHSTHFIYGYMASDIW